jgi:hypothetical protein
MQMFRRQPLVLIYFFGLLCWFLPQTAQCGTVNDKQPAQFCTQAAARVASETGVPLRVLLAITAAKDKFDQPIGKELWPWTVNVEDQPIWFESENRAQSYVFHHFKAGARSFDVGCFRLNYKWHGHAFGSIEEMFDPIQNARHAAYFLAHLYAEHENWPKVIAVYYSRTHFGAQPFLRLRNEVLAAVTAGFGMINPVRSSPRTTDTAVSNQNKFGSLMPETSTPTALFFYFEAEG